MRVGVMSGNVLQKSVGVDKDVVLRVQGREIDFRGPGINSIIEDSNFQN